MYCVLNLRLMSSMAVLTVLSQLLLTSTLNATSEGITLVEFILYRTPMVATASLFYDCGRLLMT